MQHRDYILRMIERFGQLAIALRKLILGGHAGSVAVRQQMRSMAHHAGLDLDIAQVATAETLVLFVAPGGEVEPARCWMYAETLYLDALEAEMSGDAARAFGSHHKARVLFSMVAPLGAFLVGFPEASRRIEEIDKRVSGLPGPDCEDSARGDVRPRRLRSRRIAAHGD